MMRIKDTGDSFGWLSIVLHWLTAVAVLSLLYFGIQLFVLHLQHLDQSLGYSTTMDWHIAIGTVAAPLLIWRIVRRFIIRKPRTHEQGRLLHLVAEAVWRMLLICIAAQIITGVSLTWVLGEPLRAVGVFEIPAPYPLSTAAPLAPASRPTTPAVVAPPPDTQWPSTKPRNRTPEQQRRLDKVFFLIPLHLLGGLLIASLLVLHISGALKHLLINRDRVLHGMLRMPQTRTRPNPQESPAGTRLSDFIH